MSPDLVVVGAGIVGASVAHHAARAGAAVTLVDAGRPGAGGDGELLRLDRIVRGTHRSRRWAADVGGRCPAIGRLVARELVDGTTEPVLAGCRLDRFSDDA